MLGSSFGDITRMKKNSVVYRSRSLDASLIANTAITDSIIPKLNDLGK